MDISVCAAAKRMARKTVGWLILPLNLPGTKNGLIAEPIFVIVREGVIDVNPLLPNMMGITDASLPTL